MEYIRVRQHGQFVKPRRIIMELNPEREWKFLLCYNTSVRKCGIRKFRVVVIQGRHKSAQKSVMLVRCWGLVTSPRIDLKRLIKCLPYAIIRVNLKNATLQEKSPYFRGISVVKTSRPHYNAATFSNLSSLKSVLLLENFRFRWTVYQDLYN